MEALINWLGTYGQIVAFFAQILYWIVIAVAAVWAVLLFKRLVDFRTGAGSASEDEGGSSDSSGSVSADQFVD